MKLGRIALQDPDGDVSRLVAVDPANGHVVDLRTAEKLRLLRKGATRDAAQRVAAAYFPSSMSSAIGLGDRFLEAASEAFATAGEDASIPLGEVRWLPCVDPVAVRDCLSFPMHITQSLARVNMSVSPMLLELPAFYKTSVATLIAHDEEVPWPSYSRHMDYELEFGFVVGRVLRNADPEEAGAALFGITIYNDFSARDIQSREMQLGLGPTKSKDFGTCIGPWITTLDEFGGIDKLNLNELAVTAHVNGDIWSHGVTENQLWSPAELLAYISQGDRLLPGDVVGSGTVGNGCGVELGRQLQPGDVVELHISGVGTLRNRLGVPEAAKWWPQKRSNPALPI